MARNYIAPRPSYRLIDWIMFVVVRMTIVPILFWDLPKWGLNALFGNRIGSIVLPAQDHVFDDDELRISDEEVLLHNEDVLACEKHTVITHDAAQLDTLEITYQHEKEVPPEHQTVIIFLVGNSGCYERKIKEMKADARELKANVVGFNFRGVRQSQGRATSKDHLVIDGIAEVQRVLDQGVPPENIMLKGHSLGAGVASLVAEHFHKQGQAINLFNGRSFSSISHFVVGHMRLLYGNPAEETRITSPTPVPNKMDWVAWVLTPLIRLVLVLTNWEIDAGRAFRRIPEAYRDYIVVRSQQVHEASPVDDPVIPHSASIHRALTSERREKKAALSKQIDMLSPGAPERADLEARRHRIKGERKMRTSLPNKDGHNVTLGELQNRFGESGETFFRAFYRRAYEHHASKPLNSASEFSSRWRAGTGSKACR